MRGVGDDHLVAAMAALEMVRTRDQQTGELAMRAGRRMQRHGVHAGDFRERRFEPRHQFERALAQMRGRARMKLREACQRCNLVVQHRIVLHRARTERVEVRGLRKVELREPDKMANHLRLADFGKARQIVAAQLGAKKLDGLGGGARSGRQINAAAAPGRVFENQRLQAAALASLVMGIHFLDRPVFLAGLDFYSAHARHHRASAASAWERRSKSPLEFISVTEIRIASRNSG